MEGKKRAAQSQKVKSPKKSKKGAKNDAAAAVTKIKRPLSAYLYFTKDFRAERAAEGLDNSRVNEVAKLAGAKWRGMTDDDKKQYQAKAAVDKERYQREARSETKDFPARNVNCSNHAKNNQNRSVCFSDKQTRIMEGTKGKGKKRAAENSTVVRKSKQRKTENEGKGRKSKKEKPAIKRASSSYIYFSMDFRIQLTEKCKKTGDPVPKVNEVAKLCGEKWNKLTAEDKKPFQALADKDRQRYLQETGKNVTKDSDKPKRNATAYFIFLSEFRKQMANTKLTEGQKIPSLAGEKWRSMTEKDKEPYLKIEAKEKIKYEEAMKEYKKKEKEAPKPEKKPKSKKKVEPEEDEDDEDEDEEEEEDNDDAEDDDDDDDDE